MNKIPEEWKEEYNKAKKEERGEEQTSPFILDENEVVKFRSFPFCKLDKDNLAWGIYLAKEVPVFKDKQEVSKKQEFIPVLIDSARIIHEIKNLDFERKFKIRFPLIPDVSALSRRWSLQCIKEYLQQERQAKTFSDIFEMVKAQYKKYLYFQEDQWYDIVALWDIGSYFFPLFKYYPIYELQGYKATAKTKIMTISSLISFNATEIMTNPSESSLFRQTSQTQYIDEAEKIFQLNPKTGKQEPDNRAEIINSGFKHNGYVTRVEKEGDRFIVKKYPVYAPRMIGSINGLHGATKDRAIVHITTKAPVIDSRLNLEPDSEDPIWQQIRDELYLLVLAQWKEVEYSYKHFEKELKMSGREYNLWQPLLVISNEIGLELYERTRNFGAEQGDYKREDEVDENSFLFWVYRLACIRVCDENYEGFLSFKYIKEGLPESFKNYHSKTIARMLDKGGLKQFKGRTDKEKGYIISKTALLKILEDNQPGLFNQFQNDNVIQAKNDIDKNLNLESSESFESLIEDRKEKD